MGSGIVNSCAGLANVSACDSYDGGASYIGAGSDAGAVGSGSDTGGSYAGGGAAAACGTISMTPSRTRAASVESAAS